MGVIQKILSSAKVGDERGGVVTFELNEGGVVHIQNSIWRIEMELQEFIEFATCCVEAGIRLKKLKGIDNASG